MYYAFKGVHRALHTIGYDNSLCLLLERLHETRDLFPGHVRVPSPESHPVSDARITDFFSFVILVRLMDNPYIITICLSALTAPLTSEEIFNAAILPVRTSMGEKGTPMLTGVWTHPQ